MSGDALHDLWKKKNSKNMYTRLSLLFQFFFNPILHLRKEMENLIVRRKVQAKPRQLFPTAFCIFKNITCTFQALILRDGVTKGKDSAEMVVCCEEKTQCMSSL